MQKKLFLPFMFCFIWLATAHCQKTDSENIDRKYFIGSTMFVIATPLLSPSPEYLQLNLGYQLTTKDVVTLEAITWAYRGPLGRPYGPDYENANSDFPGNVKAYGMGLTYKRFLWKGIYSQLHSTLFRQNYLDEMGKKIQSGVQLFNTIRVGYHIKLFKNRWFIEPSIAATYWPINTNLPSSFQALEDQYNNYFLFEPGLHFGFIF